MFTHKTFADFISLSLLCLAIAPSSALGLWFNPMSNIYPNPSSGLFNLQLSGDFSDLHFVSVYDLSGRLVERIGLCYPEGALGEVCIPMDLSQLNQGLYFLKLDVEDGLWKRIVICK